MPLTGCGKNNHAESSTDTKDIAIVKESVQKTNSSLLPWTSDKKLAIEKIKERASSYSMLSDALKKDKEIVEIALDNEMPIYMIDKSFSKDKAMVLLALEHSPENFREIDDSLKTDPDILLASLKSPYNGALKNIEQAPDELKNDPDFMVKVLEATADKQAIQRNYHHEENIVLFPHVNDSLKKDDVFIRGAVAVSGSLLCDLDESYRSNRELALIAVNQYGTTLTCLSKALQEDREVVLAAVRQDGEALVFLPVFESSLVNDKEIILEAINQAGNSVFYGIGTELKKDDDIVKLLKEKSGQ